MQCNILISFAPKNSIVASNFLPCMRTKLNLFFWFFCGLEYACQGMGLGVQIHKKIWANSKMFWGA